MAQSKKNSLLITGIILVFGATVFAIVARSLNDINEFAQSNQASDEYSDPAGTVYSGGIVQSEKHRLETTVPRDWKAIDNGFSILLIPEGEEFSIQSSLIREKDQLTVPTIQIDSFDWGDRSKIPEPSAIGDVLNDSVILSSSFPATRVDLGVSRIIHTSSVIDTNQITIALNYKQESQREALIPILVQLEKSLVIKI